MKRQSTTYVVGDVIGEDAWRKAAPWNRSAELTTLYLVRHTGRFAAGTATHHDHWEILTVRAGEGVLDAKHPVPLRQHTLCLVPPGLAHRETGDGHLDIIWLGISGSRVNAMKNDDIMTIASREVSDLMERMWMLRQTTTAGIGPELDALASLVVARFLRFRAGEVFPSADRVERAIKLFHQQMAEPVAIGDLAQKLGCSASCFTREFRRRTGLTPIAYLTGIRIRHAARLLATTDMRLKEVAELTGYSDAFYLTRVFARLVGRSPSLWRKDKAAIRKFTLTQSPW